MTALSSEVAICNLALTGLLGKPGIASFTENSTSAQRCDQFYPLALDEVAQASDWTFLRERKALAQVTNNFEEGWGVAYDYPNRALKLFYLFEPSQPETPIRDYRRIGSEIYANIEGAWAHYVTLQDSPVIEWPMHFSRAVAAKLAEYLAPSMTRRGSDVDAFRTMAEQHLAKAIEIDGSTEFTTYTEDETYAYGVRHDYRRNGTYDGSTFWEY
jgi:hypothetical protein